MKMICDRTLLANAVAGVSKAVTQRSSTPVLEGILMKAEGFSLPLTAVSYTHLDVYKRQPSISLMAEWMMRRSSGFMGSSVWPRPVRATFAPVSYTHLDVYKRQGESLE